LNNYLHGTYLLGASHSATVVVDEQPFDEAEDVAERALVEVAEPTGAPAQQGVIKSEIDGVSDEDWTRFVLAMKTARPGTVSATNEMGMFAMKPRRLADLKLIADIKKTRSPTGHMVWIGRWVAPMTQRKFLSSPQAQYRAFVESMRRYVEGLRSGAIPQPDDGWPEFMTASGALAVLHRCGPNGLRTWNSDRFPDTVALYERTNGIF
jgi:hypothetical protein